ncbi:MAG: D-alanyl-D-alanine carboxypeptidase/D-alanyl-D-alanine-endopeptidase [Acidobacteriota bacterium]
MIRACRGLLIAAIGTTAATTTLVATPQPVPQISVGPTSTVAAELDRIFEDPVLAPALVAARVVSLDDGRTIYTRNAGKLVMPASNMKLVTVAAAAARLGWDFRFSTTLEAAGAIRAGVLHGDLIVEGTGDPSITSPDLKGAALFDEWADALRAAGISHVDGRLIGNDNAFADEPLGAGWAWDYLSAGYAAPSGALSYNENVAVIRITPASAPGLPAHVDIGPPGHGLDLAPSVTTGPEGSTTTIDISRIPGTARLTIHGQVSVSSMPLVRTAAVDNPTSYFVDAMRLALAARGIGISGGSWDVDDLPDASQPAPRILIARRTSQPLSALAGYAMKVSQNFYGETFLKTMGSVRGVGSIERGRQAVTATLAEWGLPVESLVMSDGSGLSRYNYVTADLIVGVLQHVWNDPALRGPYLAALPVGGHDGTLETRMRTAELDRRVQAKTGTISNVRALSGYLTTTSDEKLAFSVIVNNATAPGVRVDQLIERALAVLVQ